MTRWAAVPMDRRQVALFSPTLDESLTQDHPVRLFDETLRGIDFSNWESMYVRVAGQPAIHPRAMAAGILYGLSLGIRSSRKLQDACCNRLDFIWLMEGRCPDHATICKFRTDFESPLKALFVKVGRLAMEMGLIALNQVTLDGTDPRASNSRYNTGRRPSVEQKLAMLSEQIDRAMQQAAEQDRADNALWGQSSPVKLPRSLSDLHRRQEKLKQAIKKLEELEGERAGRKDVSARGPAVGLSDPDARVLPGKSGGYAPLYTSVLASDGAAGMIVDCQVLGGNDEASTVLSAVDNIEANLGSKPDQVLADSGFNTGPNLAGLEEKQVEALMPARQEFAENPAARAEPTEPVPAERWNKLPVNPQNKILDKAAFIYHEPGDQYFCPMGQSLEYSHDKPYNRDGNKGNYRVYQCATCACANCPLAHKCLPRNATERRVSRDEYESARDRMARRMRSERGKAQYRRRSHVAETPFAVFKTVMNFRQFLLRGLRKVNIEQRWIALAYNLMKLTRFKARQLACIGHLGAT